MASSRDPRKLSATVYELQDQFTLAKIRASHAEEGMCRLQRLLNEEKGKLKELQQDYNDITAKTEDWPNERKKLQHELQASQTSIDELQGTVRMLRSQCDRLQNERDRYRALFDGNNNLWTQWRDRCRMAEQTVRSLTEESNYWSKQAAEAHEDTRELRGRHEKLKEEHQRLLGTTANDGTAAMIRQMAEMNQLLITANEDLGRGYRQACDRIAAEKANSKQLTMWCEFSKDWIEKMEEQMARKALEAGAKQSQLERENKEQKKRNSI